MYCVFSAIHTTTSGFNATVFSILQALPIYVNNHSTIPCGISTAESLKFDWKLLAAIQIFSSHSK
jgi:hypothetical protein